MKLSRPSACFVYVLLLFCATACTRNDTEIDCLTRSAILLDSGMVDQFISINQIPPYSERVLVWTALPPVFQIHYLNTRKIDRLAPSLPIPSWTESVA